MIPASSKEREGRRLVSQISISCLNKHVVGASDLRGGPVPVCSGVLEVVFQAGGRGLCWTADCKPVAGQKKIIRLIISRRIFP